jgi:hypothetical protein
MFPIQPTLLVIIGGTISNSMHDTSACICIENMAQVGYISKKLVMAFLGGCLPIYWGMKEVLDRPMAMM